MLHAVYVCFFHLILFSLFAFLALVASEQVQQTSPDQNQMTLVPHG